MKSIKLLTAGLVALVVAGSASAQSYVRIVGSSAFRKPTQEAIVAQFDAGYQTGYVGGDFNGCDASITSGTLKTNHTFVIVKTYWTGSAAGLVDLCEANAQSFMADSTVGSTYASGASYTTDSVAPNFVLSDVSNTVAAASIATAAGVTDPVTHVAYGTEYAADISTNATTLADAGVTAGPKGTVGIVPFKWVLGNLSGATAPFTNITQQQAKVLLLAGAKPLSFFTGNTADTGDFVVFVGRNEDSGTRITYLAEPQGGFGTVTKQYIVSFDGTTFPTNPAAKGAKIAGLKYWTSPSTLNGEPNLQWTGTGHGGYIVGGNVKNVLLTPNPLGGYTSVANVSGYVSGSKIYIVSCIGLTDGSTVDSSGGKELTYDGVKYSYSAVCSGAYTTWSKVHAYYLTGTTTHTESSQTQSTVGAVGTTERDVADAIADSIYGTYAKDAGVFNADLLVNRSTTGSYVY